MNPFPGEQHYYDEGGVFRDGVIVAHDDSALETTKRSSLTSTAVGMNMMAVAQKIQERARILGHEQQKTRDTEAVLRKLRQTLAEEQALNDQQRKIFLKRTNERNAVELDISELKDSIAENKANARTYKEETLASETKIRQLLAQRREDTQTLYGPALTRMDVYTTVLSTILESKEKSVEKRKNKLLALRYQLEDAKKRDEDILSETNRIETAMGREDNSSDGPVDEGITSLGKRVLEAVKERSTLRKNLKLAQKKCNESNEQMLLWEENHVERLTKKRAL